MRIIIASNNQDKIKEFSQILGPIGIEMKSLKDIELNIEVEEDCDTFEGNAMKKAVEVCKATGEISMADDSGLEVDYLDGAPGVYSARFSGPDANYAKNNEKLLDLLKNVSKEKRTARFVSVIAVAFPDGKTITSRGECKGIILNEYRGEGRFGYDPLLYYEPSKKSFGEMSKDEKNSVSHRGRALEKLKDKLKNIIG
jgi:XTP/dITP diphosphohydrolase